MQTLTEDQRQAWETDGYLHIEGALDPDEVQFFAADLDRVRMEPGWEPGDQALGHYDWLDHARSTKTDGFMDRRDLLPYGKAYVDLIDKANIFDLIVDIMGPNILLSMTQAIVRPSTDKFAGYTHTDGGEVLRRIRVADDGPPLSMKAMYMLSDVDDIDCGALTVFPGSHREQIPFDLEPPLNPHSPGAKQIMAKAGDAILFPHSLWHGPATNRSGRARKTLLYNYCQLFVRWYDFGRTPEVGGCTPRQRRLLGDLGHEFRPGDFFYVPQDQDEVICGTGSGTADAMSVAWSQQQSR